MDKQYHDGPPRAHGPPRPGPHISSRATPRNATDADFGTPAQSRTTRCRGLIGDNRRLTMPLSRHHIFQEEVFTSNQDFIEFSKALRGKMQDARSPYSESLRADAPMLDQRMYSKEATMASMQTMMQAGLSTVARAVDLHTEATKEVQAKQDRRCRAHVEQRWQSGSIHGAQSRMPSTVRALGECDREAEAIEQADMDSVPNHYAVQQPVAQTLQLPGSALQLQAALSHRISETHQQLSMDEIKAA
ncbi:unnamed protein product [Mortierella alpina]